MEDQNFELEMAAIIARILTGEISAEEQARLDAWLNADAANKQVLQRLTDKAYLASQLKKWDTKPNAEGWESLQARINPVQPALIRRLIKQTLKYAAVIIPLLVLSISGYYFYRKNINNNKPVVSLAKVNIVPGSNKARLILGNGSQIELHGHNSQAIKEEDGTSINVQDAQLVYVSESTSADNSIAPVFNTVITPRGGEYQVVLPDGTKAWLNAASSLRFPVRFTGNERKVYVTGEAYFEVTKDAAHPFVVNARKMDIRVLGTKFNVNAYADEEYDKTTLTEGHVLLTAASGGKTADLYPGFQSTIGYKDGHIEIAKANIEEALAWRNNLFVFDSEPLESIMRKVSRWYDLDIDFADPGLKQYHFTGRIKRQENVQDILNLITVTSKVKFTFNNRKLTISPILNN